MAELACLSGWAGFGLALLTSLSAIGGYELVNYWLDRRGVKRAEDG